MGLSKPIRKPVLGRCTHFTRSLPLSLEDWGELGQLRGGVCRALEFRALQSTVLDKAGSSFTVTIVSRTLRGSIMLLYINSLRSSG